MQPKVSILAPSFNHEQYVGAFIQSVLAQSMSDFELIIVDDCSRDNNVAEIQKYTDSRIKLVCHEYNQGINASVNTAFEHASGEYLVFCASDDMLEPNAIEVLYQTLRDNPDIQAVYPKAIVIDTNGKRHERDERMFQAERAEYLHYLFMYAHCFLSSGMAVRYNVFKTNLYPLDRSMCNHQDTQMNVKILLHGNVKVLDDYLVLYRIAGRTDNISASNTATSKRENIELSKLMDTFLSLNDMELLRQIFHKEIAELNIQPHSTTIPYFLGRMALTSPFTEKRIWGYHKIMESYCTKEQAAHLKELYGFDFKEYLGLVNHIEDGVALNLAMQRRRFKQYKKYKKLFKITCIANIALCVCIAILLVL